MLIKKMAPLVSVVIPCFNAEKYIGKTIASIQAQSFKDFELIVVNDGSTDATLEAVKTFEVQDQRIRIVTYENSGEIIAFQHGIREACGRYICRIDADDLACPERLATQVGILENNSRYSVVGSWVRRFKYEHIVGRVCRYPVDARSLSFFTAFGSQLVNPSTMLRRDVVADRVLPNYRIGGDFALWLELLSEGKLLANVPDVLTRYRVHANQVSFVRRSECSEVVENVYTSLWQDLVNSGIPGDALEAGRMLRSQNLTNADLSATIRTYLPEILSSIDDSNEQVAISDVILRLHLACNEKPMQKIYYCLKDLNYLKLNFEPIRILMASTLKAING